MISCWIETFINDDPQVQHILSENGDVTQTPLAHATYLPVALMIVTLRDLLVKLYSCLLLTLIDLQIRICLMQV